LAFIASDFFITLNQVMIAILAFCLYRIIVMAVSAATKYNTALMRINWSLSSFLLVFKNFNANTLMIASTISIITISHYIPILAPFISSYYDLDLNFVEFDITNFCPYTVGGIFNDSSIVFADKPSTLLLSYKESDLYNITSVPSKFKIGSNKFRKGYNLTREDFRKYNTTLDKSYCQENDLPCITSGSSSKPVYSFENISLSWAQSLDFVSKIKGLPFNTTYPEYTVRTYVYSSLLSVNELPESHKDLGNSRFYSTPTNLDYIFPRNKTSVWQDIKNAYSDIAMSAQEEFPFADGRIIKNWGMTVDTRPHVHTNDTYIFLSHGADYADDDNLLGPSAIVYGNTFYQTFCTDFRQFINVAEVLCHSSANYAADTFLVDKYYYSSKIRTKIESIQGKLKVLSKFIEMYLLNDNTMTHMFFMATNLSVNSNSLQNFTYSPIDYKNISESLEFIRNIDPYDFNRTIDLLATHRENYIWVGVYGMYVDSNYVLHRKVLAAKYYAVATGTNATYILFRHNTRYIWNSTKQITIKKHYDFVNSKSSSEYQVDLFGNGHDIYKYTWRFRVLTDNYARSYLKFDEIEYSSDILESAFNMIHNFEGLSIEVQSFSFPLFVMTLTALILFLILVITMYFNSYKEKDNYINHYDILMGDVGWKLLRLSFSDSKKEDICTCNDGLILDSIDIENLRKCKHYTEKAENDETSVLL
ncbi:hypothetical protein HK096_003322, partial [Nowakowskiella sp. JEL0078]